MMRMNTIASQFQCLDRRHRGGSHRRIDLRGGNRNAMLGEIDPVETLRIVDQGRIALGANPVDDLGNGAVNVLRHLALGGEECGKPGFKIRLGLSQHNRHVKCSSGFMLWFE